MFEVMISIFSRATDVKPELSLKGTLKMVSGRYHLLYEEENEDGRIRNHLILSEDSMEIRRSGAVESYMQFVPGTCTEFFYKNRYGSVPFSVRTEQYRLHIDESSLSASLRYILMTAEEPDSRPHELSVREFRWTAEPLSGDPETHFREEVLKRSTPE